MQRADEQAHDALAGIDGLVLVYNARSGALATAVDVVRKVFGRGVCSLCDMTHSAAGERAAWKACRAGIGVPVDALHSDELSGELTALVGRSLPAVLARVGDKHVVLLGPGELNALDGRVAALEGAIVAAVRNLETTARS